MAIYTELADDIARQIQRGVLRAGEKLPSVRALCTARGISQGTVMQAYYLLEDRGLVSTRPRSGYFVNARPRPPLPLPTLPAEDPSPVTISVGNLLYSVLASMKQRENVPLGSAFVSPLMFPLAKLAQHLGSVARRLDPSRIVDDLPPGNADLRRHIARRYLEMGANVDQADIVITNGASEALLLCLYATTRPGDVVAIETPAHYNVLHAIETSGRLAVCIPTCSRNGLDVSALARAIEAQPIRAVWAMPTFHNPTGAAMPPTRKRALVELLAKHGIPLIENDVYGELYFDDERPAPAKVHDRCGGVLHCGSFSKSLAPGYRIGWVAPGRYFEAVRQHKFLLSTSTNIPAQAALADFVQHGGYELHLRRLRLALRAQRDAMLRAITRYFPPGTCVSRPTGGCFLWVQLPPGSPDTVDLMRQALDNGISVAPGALFAHQGQFGANLRLNFGYPWNAQLEEAVQILGRLAGACGRPLALGASSEAPVDADAAAGPPAYVDPDLLPLVPEPAGADCEDDQ